MKTPPLLLGAALLFWGWQSDLPLFGAVMGIILESARVFKVRWDFSESDFRRILAFCTLLALATALYVFTDAQETGGGFHGPSGVVGRALGISSVKTSNTFFRWLPIFLFLFVAAQTFSTREKIPLFTISRWLAWQRRNKNAPAGNVNMSYPYFMLCLFSASVHANKGGVLFFWGQCVLISWALWRFRSRRSGIFIWALALAVAMGLGNFGQQRIGALQLYIENYDAQWLMRFMRPATDPTETITSMGQIGELKLSARIVIRLQTKNGEPPPEYLREASYRAYTPTKKSWYAGPRSDFDHNTISPEHDQTTWVLLSKTNTASVNIACYLDGRSVKTGNPQGLLPLPAGSGRLENLPAYILERNGEGAVLAEGPGLVIFDALYGPGKTIDAPPEIDSKTNMDFLVPSNEIPALDSVISEMKISGANEEQKLRAVQNFFSGKFTYRLWQGPDKLATTNETALTRFLLHSRSGHCEYFATATVLLLREMGIPARYAVGYYVHEPSGHGYVVRERDAHAWCLVWDRQTKTWENFDTTPASWIGIEGNRASAMQWFSDFWSWVGFEFAKLRWGQTNLREYIFWALIPVLALLLFQIIFKRGRRQRSQPRTGKSDAAIFWPGLDSEFYLLESHLAARGVPRAPGEPLSIWLSRAAADPTLAEMKNSLEKLLRLHYRHRFDPHGLNETDREMLRLDARVCLARLAECETGLALKTDTGTSVG
ncbi:MAG TPA: transglutaminase domain-containing protein [Verrucomicrobiae bacterium]